MANAFEFGAFRQAFEAQDVDAWLAFYADDAEWIEYHYCPVNLTVVSIG